MGRTDHKIYDWGFHLEQERIEGAAIGRTREGKSVERGNAIAQGDGGDVILVLSKRRGDTRNRRGTDSG